MKALQLFSYVNASVMISSSELQYSSRASQVVTSSNSLPNKEPIEGAAVAFLRERSGDDIVLGAVLFITGISADT